MIKKFIAILIIILICAVSIYFKVTSLGNINRGECITDFEDFLTLPYSIDRTIKPESPWKKINIPEEFQDNFTNFKLLNNTAQESELWLISSSWSQEANIIVYNLDQSTWKIIDTFDSNTGIWISEIYQTNENDIYGLNTFTPNFSKNLDLEVIKTYPTFSKYNPNTNRFEPLENILNIPINERGSEKNSILINRDKVIYDKNGYFWIYVQNQHSLYKFFPSDNNIVFVKQFPEEFNVANLIIDSSGTLLFQKKYFLDPFANPQLIKFNPTTQLLSSIVIEEKLARNDIYISNNGNLWFGSLGYLDKDQNWHFEYPFIIEERFKEKQFVLTQTYTDIILEDSSGIVWHRAININHEISGIAWQNPKTNKGCQTLISSGPLVEDKEGNIWLLDGENLYKLEKEFIRGFKIEVILISISFSYFIYLLIKIINKNKSSLS